MIKQLILISFAQKKNKQKTNKKPKAPQKPPKQRFQY